MAQYDFAFTGSAYTYTTNFAFGTVAVFSVSITEAASASSSSDVVITITVAEVEAASSTSTSNAAFTGVVTQQESTSALDTVAFGIVFAADLFEAAVLVETAQTAVIDNVSATDGAFAQDAVLYLSTTVPISEVSSASDSTAIATTAIGSEALVVADTTNTAVAAARSDSLVVSAIEGVETGAASAEPLSASTAENSEVGSVVLETAAVVDSPLATTVVNVSLADLGSATDITASTKTLVVDVQEVDVLTSTTRIIPGWTKRNSDMAFIFF